MIGHIVRHDVHRRRATVRDVASLSLRLRRLVLSIETGEAPVPSVRMAVGEHVKLAFPHPQTGALDLSAGRDRLVTRDYTIRAVADPEKRTGGGQEHGLVVDVVVHGTGPGSTWAQGATPGSAVDILGPRGSHVMPDDRARYLILADESAHPAVARWLEEAPVQAAVQVVIQSPDGTTAELPARDTGDVRCIVGTDGSGLADQLRAWSPRAGDFVWAAGEAGAMLAVRRAARDLDLSPDDVEIDGYWKAGVAGRDHHEPLES